MPENATRRSGDEVARLGTEMYATRVKPLLRQEDENKYVVVDVDTGDFEVDDLMGPALDRMLARRPDAELWLERAGSPAAVRLRTPR
jgi:hypothetical protein